METLSPESVGIGMMFALQDDERLLMQIVSGQGWLNTAFEAWTMDAQIFSHHQNW
jgi:hypothetical protein